MELTAIKLAAKTVELWPEPVEPWQPEAEPPRRRSGAPRPLVVGGQRVRVLVGGRRAAREARWQRRRVVTPAIFERDEGGWRAASGRERGERLRVDGERLVWAGYPFTRAQEPFAGLAVTGHRVRDHGRRVDADQQEALPALRPAVADDDQRRERRRRAIVATSTSAERQRQPAADDPGEQRDRGGDEHGDLHRRDDRDLGREPGVAALRDHDRAAVLGGIAHDRDDDDRDEELPEPDRVPELVQRVDEDLGDEGGRDGRDRRAR